MQRVERLRIVSDEPIAHEVAYLAGSYPRLAAELARRGSLYLTLAEAYGVELTDAEDAIETALASPDRGAAAGRGHRSADAADPADRLGRGRAPGGAHPLGLPR